MSSAGENLTETEVSITQLAHSFARDVLRPDRLAISLYAQRFTGDLARNWIDRR